MNVTMLFPEMASKKRQYKSGTVRKRSNSSFEICYRVNGKRQYETIKTNSEDIAETELRKRLVAVAEGADEKQLGTLFKEVANQWMAGKLLTKQPKTAEHYEGIVRCHLLPAFADDYLHQIDPAAISDYVQFKLEGNTLPVAGSGSENALSARTVGHHLAAMKNILNYAVKHGYIDKNAAEGIEKPQTEPTELPDVSAEDIKNLLGEMPDDTTRLLTLLMVSLGLRVGEALGLRGRDWSETRKELHISGSIKIRSNSPYRAGAGKTKGSNRILSVSDELADQITARVAVMGRGLLFPSGAGNPQAPNNFRRRVFYPAAARAGIDGLAIHGLRHIWATTMLAQGTPPHILMSQGGWSSLAAMGNYAHLMGPSRLQAADTTALYT